MNINTVSSPALSSPYSVVDSTSGNTSPVTVCDASFVESQLTSSSLTLSSASSISSLGDLKELSDALSPPTLSSLAHSVAYPILQPCNTSPIIMDNIAESSQVSISDSAAQTDRTYFGAFLDEMMHYSPLSAPLPNVSRPSTDFLLKPNCVSSSEIDSDVLKFLLDHLIDKYKNLENQLSELNAKVETKSNEICKDIDVSMEDLVGQFNVQFNDLKNSVNSGDTREPNVSADIAGVEKLKELEKSIFDLDVRLIECEQYPRRENIIISGIPEFVTHDRLKEQAVTICSKMGLDINEHDIAACHRLPKGQHSRWPANTIVRFFSRDHVAYCLKNAHKLKNTNFKREINMNLRIFENLAPKNSDSLRIAKWLLEQELISSYFLRNGYVKIVINDGDNPIRIRHPNILREMFSDIPIDIPLTF